MTPSVTNLASHASAEAHPNRPSPTATIVNAASANPSLSHLKEGADEPASKPSLPDPPAVQAHQRSFSWQHIPGVPTYAAYDVDAFRAARAASAEPGGAPSTGREVKGRKEEEQEGPMLPPPAPGPRGAGAQGRKRLFYFSDEHGGE